MRSVVQCRIRGCIARLTSRPASLESSQHRENHADLVVIAFPDARKVQRAEVAELADAADSKSAVRKGLVGSTPTFGIPPAVRRAEAVSTISRSLRNGSLQSSLESSPESSFKSSFQSLVESSGQSSFHRIAHRSGQRSRHRFPHRLRQSSLESSGQSSSESLTQSSFQGFFQGFFESQLDGTFLSCSPGAVLSCGSSA